MFAFPGTGPTSTGEDEISTLVNATPVNELYHIESADEDFYKILTTEKTGIFVPVKNKSSRTARSQRDGKIRPSVLL